MNKGIIMGLVGAVVGVAVAFGAFTFLMGGGDTVEAAPETVVEVPGKIGPHITLADRVFNLLPSTRSSANYLKLQAIIEFETTDQRWEHVLTGCGKSAHGAVFAVERDLFVAAVPGGPASAAGASAGAPSNPCEEELANLLSSFEQRIGNGRSLIEDAVTTIVTGHTADEISTPAGKDLLKAEIQAAVDALFHEDPKVKRILFINFITQ